MKKKFFILFCVLPCMLACSSNLDDLISDKDLSKKEGPNMTMRMDERMEEGDASHQYLANVLFKKIEESISSTSEKDSLKRFFPDYFGGAYTDQRGMLTILIKGDIERGRKNILSYVRDNSILTFKECDYSYQELTDIIDVITAHLQDFPEKIRKNIYSYYLDDIGNKVVINLYNIEEESINQISRLGLNNKAIKYSEIKGNSTPLYTAKPMDYFWEYIQPGSVLFCYANNRRAKILE